jgi:trans-aconitate 2-methyltransferase
MSWDPAQYLKYSGERLRPALDLLARVGVDAPRTVVDLGCGAGNVTRILAERWPGARVIGFDNSASMLAQARHAVPTAAAVEFREAELTAWAAAPTPAASDVIFSNAALHWLDDHATLFPRLMNAVAPGGAFAVQMPSNFQSPSHVELRATAESARWRSHVGAVLRSEPVAPIARYYAWLAPLAATVDAWTTEYLHALPAVKGGDHPVVAWVKGSALTPVLAALDPDAGRAFVADYALRIARAYPVEGDGRVLFPFRRIFIVATRAKR